jgi:vacuolar protein sorting-associated protein 3
VNGSPTFILASRLQPSGHSTTTKATAAPGVQQILVFPGPAKACVLCNGTVSFYSLPEMSPAFPNREPTGVQWIGGIDENDAEDNPDGPVLMIANSRRIILVRVGDKLKAIRNNIEFPGCLKSSRRDTIACVADDTSYALLEVEHQQKIPLFPISSLPVEDEAQPESISRSPARSPPPVDSAAHARSTSMGNLIGSTIGRRESSSTREQSSSHLRPPDSGHGGVEPNASPGAVADRPKARPRASTDALPTRAAVDPNKHSIDKLKPHILSPFPSEFMLTTGTSESEPGVGLFVNLDGDVVRGTIDFESYPEDIIIDNFSIAGDQSAPQPEEEGKVICSLLRTTEEGMVHRKLELQAVGNASELAHSRTLLSIPQSELQSPSAGLSHTFDTHASFFNIIGELLQLVPLQLGSLQLDSASEQSHDSRTDSAVEQLEQEKALFESQSVTAPVRPSRAVVDKRAAEESKFAGRFGRTFTRNVVWQGEKIYMILPNPLISQLEYRLMQHVKEGTTLNVKPTQIFGFLASIHGREPKDEAEFLAMSYVRQKASLVLFLHLQNQISTSSKQDDALRAVENTLHDGGLDPRILLLLSPPLSAEVLYSSEGIWLHQGMADLLHDYTSPISSFEDAPIEYWMMLRHYLMLWQEKRGYGSITDDKYVFDSIDAALLHVLLYLDQALPIDSPAQKSVRAKLHNVVDHWKGDFERAIALLEHYGRLYILSRLYQSKKQARDVLGTWRRIVDGEKDADYGSNVEFVEGQFRRYLTAIRDVALMKEYTLWLAQKNPDLAIQVLTDDAARVRINPHEVVVLLKEHAPAAVEKYLEHLVFGKHLDQYADDLIGYYLDSVLTVLESSEEARTSLAESYSTYRALESPKPTYLDFIHQNAPSDQWWQSRLRLLQLLGTGAYASASKPTTATGKDLTYSVDKVLTRLAPFSTYLVSESIILDARQSRHKEALRLLTHGLGDYDTAIRYCYFGGPSPSSSYPIDPSLLPSRTKQSELFIFLFHEFLQIATSMEDRLHHTSALLGKFATFFDPLAIIADVPDDWSVNMLGEFLVRSFRAATTERNQLVIVKALSAAQNLIGQVEFIGVCEKIGATVEGVVGGDVEMTDVGGGRDVEVS